MLEDVVGVTDGQADQWSYLLVLARLVDGYVARHEQVKIREAICPIWAYL